MHDVVIVGIPLFAIVAGILFNRQDTTALRTEIAALRSELRGEIHTESGGIHARLDSIQRDMREFYAEQVRHDVRITKLEQRG